jgi:hypothetical protein
MKTIKIRDLRGALLEKFCAEDVLVGITNNRALAAVMVPVGPRWVEHIVEMNWSRVNQSVAEGEAERIAGRPFVSLDVALAAADASQPPVEPRPAATSERPLDIASPIAVMRRVSHLWSQPGHPTAPAQTSGTPSVRTVRIGDLNGEVLTEAGNAGELVAVTNDRILIAFLIPVTEQLVTHLVENNLSRVMYNVFRGEHERRSGTALTSLDEALTLSPSDVRSPAASALQRVEESRTAASQVGESVRES